MAKLRFYLGFALFFAGLNFTIIGLWTVFGTPAAPPTVVCESGAEQPVFDNEDPYLRYRTVCHAGNVNGPEVQVLTID